MLVVHEGTFQWEVVMISVLLDKRSLSFCSSDNIYTHLFQGQWLTSLYELKQDLLQTRDADSGMTRLLEHPAAKISSLIVGLALNRSLAITPRELLISFTRFLARFEIIPLVNLRATLWIKSHISDAPQRLVETSNDSAECGNKHPLSSKTSKYYWWFEAASIKAKEEKTAICTLRFLKV